MIPSSRGPPRRRSSPPSSAKSATGAAEPESPARRSFPRPPSIGRAGASAQDVIATETTNRIIAAEPDDGVICVSADDDVVSFGANERARVGGLLAKTGRFGRVSDAGWPEDQSWHDQDRRALRCQDLAGIGAGLLGSDASSSMICFSAGCLGGKGSADLALSGVCRIAVVRLYRYVDDGEALELSGELGRERVAGSAVVGQHTQGYMRWPSVLISHTSR